MNHGRALIDYWRIRYAEKGGVTERISVATEKKLCRWAGYARVASVSMTHEEQGRVQIRSVKRSLRIILCIKLMLPKM